MNEIRQELIRKAREYFKDIRPCSSKKDFSECFTVEGDRICFWFNTADRSTHMLVAKL